MLFDDAPIFARIRRADRLAFKEDAGCANEQRRIDDIGMADNPAHIGGRPPDLPRLDVEDVFHRPDERHHMPAIVAHDALRLAGRAGGVKHVERVGRGHRHARHMASTSGIDRFAIIDVASFHRQMPVLFTLEYDAMIDLVMGKRNSLVQHGLIGHHARWLNAA